MKEFDDDIVVRDELLQDFFVFLFEYLIDYWSDICEALLHAYDATYLKINIGERRGLRVSN